MIRKYVCEALRRKDVGCAQRARWLGMPSRREAFDRDAAQEQLRRAREAARLTRPELFNRR